MKGYENLRKELSLQLMGKKNVNVYEVLLALDAVAERYDITEREQHLEVYRPGLPEIARLYLAVKKLEGCTDATVQGYKIYLDMFFTCLRKNPEDVVANDIRGYLAMYKEQRHIKDSSLNDVRGAICRFFRWATEEGYLKKNPGATVQKIKAERTQRTALTQLEMEQMRDSCKTLRERAIVELLYSTGCRVSELARLKRKDVDWYEKTVHIYGKGKKHRTSYINTRAEVALKNYMNTRHDDNEYLIDNKRKKQGGVTGRRLEEIVTEIAERAQMKKHVTPHILRHTTATTALDHGMPITDISRMLGHENIATTMIYAETNDQNVKMQHRRCVI